MGGKIGIMCVTLMMIAVNIILDFSVPDPGGMDPLCIVQCSVVFLFEFPIYQSIRQRTGSP